jgi:hypothetical protein
MLHRRQSDPEQLLRDMRNDLRFLSYRAGRTPSIVIKFLLLNLLVFFALGFAVEIYAVFFAPAHQAPPKTSQQETRQETHP